MDPARMLLALAAIVVLARAAGWGLARLGQPAVIGELAVGIVLGPTLLAGRLGRTLVPSAVRPDLSLLGTLGVILLTLLVALRLAPENRRELRAAGTIATGSMLAPLAAGTAVGAVLAARYRPAGVGEAPFILFLGAATAVTAFPVLARILAERGWETLSLGRLALTAAALGDLVTWLLVTAVLALAGAQGAHSGRLWLLFPYAAALLVVRVGAGRLWAQSGARNHGDANPTTELGLLVAGAVASAAVTEWMGLQVIFGAFAFGLAIPRAPARAVLTRAEPAIEPAVTVLLLPVYFVLSGLKVDLSHIGGAGLLALALIGVAAVGGKTLGVLAGARVLRMDWRSSLLLAALLDTRGLTEILVLTLGLQQHIIGTKLFSLMIVMALGTTLLTGPVLNRLSPKSRRVPEPV
jgi:Kef-type K+ transport system membrane component KefB